jgi:hypothetical protein
MEAPAMATTFVGFYRQLGPIETEIEAVRKTGAIHEEFTAKIRELPSKLPPTCKLIGSWNISGGQVPGVMVVEAESYADLQFINSHYFGWLVIDWHPVPTGGVERN